MDTLKPDLNRPLLLLIGGLIAVWAIVIHQLSAQWTVSPQYHYGWGVPVLMLYLFAQRWKTRPNTEHADLKNAIYLAAVACLAFWPTRILHEANPIWRLTSWAMTLEVVGLTLAFIWIFAGKPWVRHFGFAISFFVLAVPWPSSIENGVIQGLTRANAGVVIVFLNLWGTPSIQRGNVIELPTGLVGVEEGCSGINSLQTAIMVTVFLGELLTLGWKRRLALIGIGLGAAFAGNTIRTFTLVQICGLSGTDALHRWHDTVGVGVLAITFVAVLLSARVLKKREVSRGEVKGEHFAIPPISWRWASTFVLWVGLVEISCEIWFRSHENHALSQLSWTVHLPPGIAEKSTEPEVMRRAQEQLRYDRGNGVRWTDVDGSNWQTYFFEWQPARGLESRVRAQLAKSHRPDICLPSVGMTFKSSLGVHFRKIGSERVPFQEFLFQYQGQPVFVYFSATEGVGAERERLANARERVTERVRAALEGSRNFGLRWAEIVIWGYQTKAEADAALDIKLAELVHVAAK